MIPMFLSWLHTCTHMCLQVDSFPDSVEVRAVIEGQCMSRRVHAENLGFDIGTTSSTFEALLFCLKLHMAAYGWQLTVDSQHKTAVSLKLKIYSWKLTLDSWQLTGFDWQWAADSSQLIEDSWWLTVDSWHLTVAHYSKIQWLVFITDISPSATTWNPMTILLKWLLVSWKGSAHLRSVFPEQQFFLEHCPEMALCGWLNINIQELTPL